MITSFNNIFNHYIIYIIIIFLSLSNINWAFDSSLGEENNSTRNNSYQPEGWSKDIRLSDPTNDYSSQFPHITMNGLYVHILWDENRNSSDIPGHGLCYRRSSDFGNTWRDIIYLSYPNGSFSNAIAAYDSNIHIIFTSELAEGILYRRSMDNGTTWGPIITNITNYGGTDLNIGIYDNNIHIVWSYKYSEEGIWGILYLRSNNNGDTWEQARWLLKGTGSTFKLRPRLIVSKNYIYVGYWGVNDTIELLSSHDNGDTWEHKILFNGPDAGSTVIAGNANHVGVVWVNKSKIFFELEFIKSDDYGKTWSEPKIISDNVEGVDTYEPCLIMVENTYHLVWSDFRDSSMESRKIFTEIYYKKSTDAGITWTKDIKLTDTQEDCDNPYIAVYNNNLHVVWEDERVDGQQIFSKRMLPDFTVDNLTVTSSEPSWANSSINMNISLKNIGFADGYFVNVTVNYLYEPIFHGQINNIKLGEVEEISFNWTPITSGMNNLAIIIDQQKVNQEWDESNNVFTKDFIIQDNSAPMANLKVNQSDAKVLQKINFDASGSYDPDGTIEAYYFNFGDGNNSGWIENSKISYSYQQAGDYICSVGVLDNYNAMNSNKAEHEIAIEWLETPPRIDNVTIDPINPVCNEDVMIIVSAFDLNSDELTYFYTPENGTITGKDESVIWQAPEMPGEYELSIKVFDGKAYSSYWITNISVYKNQEPIIHNINFISNVIDAGESLNISINATDPNGHELQYSYQVNGGELIENSSSIVWYSPLEDGIYKISINVTDGRAGYNYTEIFFLIGNPEPNAIIIKSFKIEPERIYKGEHTELFVALEVDEDYINFISQVQINLSEITGNSAQYLFDTGDNGDCVKNDGIFSYKLSIKISNSTGDYQLWANVKTVILNFELNASTNLKIEEKPTENQKPLTEIYLGSLIILILIFIIIAILWFKKKKSRPAKKS